MGRTFAVPVRRGVGRFPKLGGVPEQDEYEQFVAQVAETREAWLLTRGENRASTSDDDAELPVIWADEGAAAEQATDDWKSLQPTPLPVHRLLELCHELDADGGHFAALYDGEGNYLELPAGRLRDDLLDALEADQETEESHEPAEQEVEGVRSAGDEQRYDYFVGKASDFGEVWSLRRGEDWASLTDDAGTRLFPVWPARAFAASSLTGDWSDSEPFAMEVHRFLEFCRFLKDEGDKVALTPAPGRTYLEVDPESLADDLRTALDAVQ